MTALDLALFLNDRMYKDQQFAHLEIYVMVNRERRQIDNVKAISSVLAEEAGVFFTPK